MELTLIEQFTFIAHSRNGKYATIDSNQRAVGLTGAILLQLFSKGALSLENDKIITQTPEHHLLEPEQDVWNRIEKRTKPRKLKRWIQSLYTRSERWRKWINNSLEQKGYFEIEHKKLLFIPYKIIRVKNTKAHDQLTQRLRGLLNEGISDASALELQLLGLAKACKMVRALARDKADRKVVRKQLKALNPKDLVSSEVGSAISEIEAAVMVTIMASTTAAVIATTTATSSSS